ncbi:carbohydrate ABC transporter permease [Paenibacillus sp. TAB 01]|uniref:carbohydrate ABC transporter permease n=1 Tax=Paenibacillus sp. TAB 01 TaxID=3368988 RepID=UPI003751829D
MKTSASGYAVNVSRYALLIVLAAAVIYPIIWVILGSLKSEESFYTNPWGLPDQFHWEVYNVIFTQFHLQVNVWNSFYISAVSTLVVILFSAMAAYGMIRLKWKGSKAVLGLILLGIMIPVHSTLIPIYLDLQSYNKWIDPRILLMLPYAAFGIPTSVLILTGYYATISRDMEEAAVIDGSSLIGCFFRIILPISMPAIATVAILSFIHSWNELLYALIFLKKTASQTLPVALLQFMGFYSTDWAQVLAAITVGMVPGILIYMILQNYIVQGITAGAVKG